MEFHKSLYKMSFENNSPKKKSKANLKDGRQNRRIERFQENRIISLSPVQSSESKIGSPKVVNNKENEQGIGNVAISRHEAFVARFIAWKKKKEMEKNQKVPKKPPFVSACFKNTLSSKTENSFAPENHKFKPPASLIIPYNPENCKYIIRNLEKADKAKVVAQSSNLPIERNGFNKKLCTTPKSVKKSKSTRNTNSEKSSEKKNTPFNSENKQIKSKFDIKTDKKPLTQSKTPLSNKNNNEAQSAKNKIAKSTDKIKPGTFVKLSKPTKLLSLGTDSATKNIAKPKCLKVVNNKLSSNDLKKESKDANDKQYKGNFVQTKKSVLIKSPIKSEKAELKRPFLAQKTPRKNPTYLKGTGTKTITKNINSNINYETKQANRKGSKEKNLIIQPPKLMFFEKPEIVLCQETPIENPEKFNSFITSTQRKESGNCGTILPSDINKANISNIKPEDMENVIKNLPLVNLFQEPQTQNEILATPLDTSKTNLLDKTPINTNIEEEPIIYTSPYVTMSRGKGSGKKEKKLRESIYTSEESKNGIVSVELRRARETAKYFRKMLSDEINRLHSRCDEWLEYVKNTDPTILEDCGNDMINVAVGQTKLLTSKKFNQFKTLIEQCEQFAEVKYNLKKNNDENQKPILPEDLEGFWQMMYIQVDDIDKRFNKLECWRSNNWKDPDEVHIEEKIKKKSKLLTKVSKKKVQGSNPVLRKYLKEMYIACIKNKKQELEEDKNDIIITTPSKKSRRSSNINENKTEMTPLRRSKRISSVKENTVKTSTPSRKSLRIESVINNASKYPESHPGTPKNGVRLISLIKTPCLGCPSTITCSPKPNKSILKTPGTQKRRQTVIFNEHLQFKSPDKSFDSEKKKRRRSSSAKKNLTGSSDKKERRKSLNLRARRLILDLDAKIDIPQKKNS